MTAEFEELHAEVRTAARQLLRQVAPPQPLDWRVAAASGWLGLEADADQGGAGATFAEVALICTELGRAVTCSPYLGAAVLGMGALALLESSAARNELVRETAEGNAVPAVALSAARPETSFRLEENADGQTLNGAATFVPDAATASTLLIPAVTPEQSYVVVQLDPAATGLSVTDQPVLDLTRRFAEIVAERVSVPEAAIWPLSASGDAWTESLRRRGALATACDSLGIAEAMLDATVDHVRVRKQFGRAIGSFQAVKHACADMMVNVAVARELVDHAVTLLARDESEADPAVSMAKSYACSAAVEVAGKAMQLHGGMGYTWESGVHYYLKRAALNRSIFGSATWHRKRLAGRYGDVAHFEG
jgi:alkylation response protein AidB-like acyl-CoA dehydrogenase